MPNILNGWMVLDKPEGISSAQAVGRVKRLLKPAKIGHAGTLDPLASGILPLALGEATKTCGYMMNASKSYRFTAQWGAERSTDDREGEVTETSTARPTEADVLRILPEFTGTVQQVPPVYSAIKVKGERSYALARQGEAVELKPRTIRIDTIQVVGGDFPQSTTFEVTCGKGTYIRSLARDMGRRLGCLAYVSALRRLRVGKFCENHAISLAKLEQLVHTPAPDEWLLPVESALDDILAITLDSHLAPKLRSGNAVLFRQPSIPEGSTVYTTSGGKLIALAEFRDGWLRPVRVFNC